MAKDQATIEFKIVTPQGVVYDDQIEKITIPTQSGLITVLPNHQPLVSLLRAGELQIHKDESMVALAVSTGFFEIHPNSKLFIMADTAERAQDIDVQRAEEAKKRAEQLLKEQENVADVDFARIQAAIEKELSRLDVARKYKNIKR